jgi:phosphoribosyl-ATP pyrophosphohydrolase
VIIPSIDVMDGKAVQLRQGKEKVLEREDVLELAREFSVYGEIAVIDLDAALGKGDNLELIKRICRIADCRVGGGIRDEKRATSLLQAGAKKIIIGTRADEEFLSKFPRSRLIVALDASQGKVVDKGWTGGTEETPMQRMKRLEKYCCAFLYTDVDKEGMMQGARLDTAKELNNTTQNRVVMAGGLTTLEEIATVEKEGMDSQIGMALYTGAITLPDAVVSSLDFEKGDGLIPTLVQDIGGRVLMMAYSSPESVRKSLEIRKATYFSRSRQELWTKGETSGNYQDLLKISWDCDRDTLLYTVDQTNVACHTGTYSCFEDKGFTLDDLYGVLKGRMENPVDGSYTNKLLENESKIMEKIIEESKEVVNYTDRQNLVWEIADLTYFLQVLMVKNGIEPKEITNELWRRRK